MSGSAEQWLNAVFQPSPEPTRFLCSPRPPALTSSRSVMRLITASRLPNARRESPARRSMTDGSMVIVSSRTPETESRRTTA